MIQEKTASFQTREGMWNAFVEKTRRHQDALLMLFGFSMVLSVSVGAILAGVISAVWLLNGNLKERWLETRSNRVAVAFLLFFALHVLGMLWTEDLRWGLYMIEKQWRILFVPILMTMMRKERADHYIAAFLAGMTVLHFVYFMYALGLTEMRIQTHVTYNVLLALACYLVLYYIVFRELNVKYKVLLSVLFVSFTANMFMTIGRAGQLAYFLAIALILIQYYSKNLKKGLILAILIIPAFFTSMYFISETFQYRIYTAFDEIKNYERDKPSRHVNDRITFYLNTLHIIKANPIIGVGTGDFREEYRKINEIYSPEVEEIANPHNNYLLVLGKFGILGLIFFIYIFYTQFIHAKNTKDEYSNLRYALLIIFLFVMNFDSYMLSYYSAVTYVYFTGFLYK